MTDIVEKLRMDADNANPYCVGQMEMLDAADEIETLRQRVSELEGYKAAWIETSKCRDRAEKELTAERAISDKLEKALVNLMEAWPKGMACEESASAAFDD